MADSTVLTVVSSVEEAEGQQTKLSRPNLTRKEIAKYTYQQAKMESYLNWESKQRKGDLFDFAFKAI